LGRFQQVRANVRRAYEAGRASATARRAEEGNHRTVSRSLVTAEGSRPAEPEAPVQAVATPSVTSRDDEDVPRALRIAAAWSWRLLIIAAATVAVLWVIGRLKHVVIPVAIALLLAALLSPAVRFLRDRVGLHRSLATALVMIGGLAVIAGTLTLVITQFVNSWDELSVKSESGIHKIQDWLKRGPAHLSDKQLNSMLDGVQNWLKTHQSTLTTGAVSTATTTLSVLASSSRSSSCATATGSGGSW
jgi:hypothetical protein